jgi:hypothetical protein
LTGAVLGLLCFVPAASASLGRPKDLDRPAELRPALARSVTPAAPRPAPAVEAQITDESEVYLDGRRCAYKDVPDGSSIERLVLAGDGRTIIRVDFRSPR